MRFKFGVLIAAILGVLGGTVMTAPAAQAASIKSSFSQASSATRQVKVQPVNTNRGEGRRRADAFTCDLYTHICAKFSRPRPRPSQTSLVPV